MRRVVIALSVLVAGCGCGFALNPSLNISQHAHTSWIVAQTHIGQSLSAPGSPANLRFAHLSVADGLSHADVRAIAQDHQGFMWFGTWLGGLNRFDGYTFKVYKHDAKDERSLGNDSVRTLYVDRDGVLWIGTNAGVDRYYRATDSFIHYSNLADNATRLPHFFYGDKSGTLWLSSADGLSRFDQASGRFYTYRRNPNNPTIFGDTNGWPICEDKTTGLLWLGFSDEGVTVLDRSSGHFTRYKNNPNDPASLSSNGVVHIFQDRRDILWISTAGGLNRFDPQTRKFIRYRHDPKNPATLSDDYVAGTYEDRAGRFWVTTTNGLNLMDRARGTFTRYLHDPNDPSSLSGNVINPYAFYEDSAGTLWIGTRSTGVDRLSAEAERFGTYRHNPQDANSPSSDTINGLAFGSAGELWIGTEAGLDRFDGRTFTHYLADANRPSSLSQGPQRMVAPDANGKVWTGTYGGGLDRLDGQRVRHFRHDPENPDSPANDSIASLVPDPTGGLWIGVHGKGMDYFDGRHFTHFSPDNGDPAGLPDAYVLPLLLDERGMLWMGTASWGLVRFDTHIRKFTTYLIDPNQPGSQAVNWVHDIYSDGASLWVASPTGLFRFDPATGTFARHYTEKDGLASNSTVSVLGDAQGNVWVGTVKGLSKFEPRTETFRNYDRFGSLQGDQFTTLSRAKAPDGRLFFGSINGLAAFHPERLVDNPTPPPVLLTEFELFNKPVKVGDKGSPLRQAIHVASSITLRHDQSVFRFQFAALDFTDPQKNQYAYKLEGFDRDWQYTDATRRFATYTNLDPGDYTFRVKASNNDGVWNEQGVALHLRMLPPWWNTTWFLALGAAIFVSSLWAAYQFRVRQLQHDFSLRGEERVNERIRIARELHDTLLQSVQASLVQMQVARTLLFRQPEKAVGTLDQAISITEGAIAESRDAIQDLRSQPSLESNLLKLLTLAGEELATGQDGQSKTAKFRVRVEGERAYSLKALAGKRNLNPLIQDEAYRIARELLRNAFQHANASEIEAEIRYESRAFRLRVRDDGKGIDANFLEAGGRTGHWGLTGMRERAKRIGGQLEIWSNTGAGTEVELMIPAAVAYARATNGQRWWWRGRKAKL
jgi:ligand-binding sensor domain-containing protein/signal transduction histidine kinase